MTENSSSDLKVEVDSDHFIYDDDPAFPWPTRVDDNDCRWFLQRSPHYEVTEGDRFIRPRFRLADNSELAEILAAKSASDTVTSYNATFSSFTIQTVKDRNEDRVFVHAFDRGTVFGVFDGHHGIRVSEKAARELPLLLSALLGAALGRTDGRSLPEVTQAVEDAFSRVILDFDAALFKGLRDTLNEFEEEYKGLEWGEEHLQYFLWLEEKEGAQRPAFALEGSTALLGFIPASSDHVWVACVGDSEAHHARLNGGEWVGTPLSELHGVNNPAEAERLRSEHPGEDVIGYNRVLELLPLTRALGDYLLKVPMDDIVKYFYRSMRPVTASPDWFDTCAQKYKTAPYLSAQPTFKHTALNRGDVLIFATDGLRNILDIHESLADSVKDDMFVSLAGFAVSGTGHLTPWEEKLGHRFLERDAVENPAAWTVQSILFGRDRMKFAREMTIEVPLYKRWQDDITLLVMAV
ncbi:protein serine/threonine phosphatase 2C [Auricularia subglabra TFB-10046 SS5]|nr:protein serine/threonine phosphatase 2C [Auricularia subglabra TFB-10046 SS5]